MTYSVTSFTSILTLKIAPFLFISVGVLCEFAMVPDVYHLLTPHEAEMHCFFIFGRTIIENIKSLSAIILLC